MNLVAERFYILGCLTGNPHRAFIYDSTIQSSVRQLVGAFEGADEANRRRIVREFAKLYDTYGPGIWKCILEFAYLLHTTSEAQDMFAPVLDRLESDLKIDNNLATELVNELGWHARTPCDFTYKLVDLSLNRLARCGNAISEVISNKDADPSFRLAAANQAIRNKNEEAYNSILQFFIEISNSRSTELYSRIIIPLKQLYSGTGREGLLLAISAFENGKLGPQGPNLLSSFRNEFATWFLSNQPRASIEWARVLLKAWQWADDVVERDHLLTILIDDWCSIARIAGFVRRKIQQSIRSDRNYLVPASRHVRARVLLFGAPSSGHTVYDLENRLRNALQAPQDKWREYCKHMPLEHTTGIAASKLFKLGTEQIRERILLLLAENITGQGFQRTFFRRVVKPYYFQDIPTHSQLQIMKAGNLLENVTTLELNKLLELGNALHSNVISELKRNIILILQQSNLENLREA